MGQRRNTAVKFRQRPHAIILAGPNGAGKSTAAPSLLAETLRITEFVNADVIARGLSGFAPDNAAIEAASIMYQRLHELAALGRNFAFETTLAGRTLAAWLKELHNDGYTIHLHFLWLSSADLAVARVRQRVAEGGHDVPEETVRRRYYRGIYNFRHLYRPLTSSWRCYDNSNELGYRLIALGSGDGRAVVKESEIWQRIVAG